MGGLPFRVTTALLALPGLALAVLGGINLEQRRVFQLPCDGVSWADSPRGVTAWVVARDGPGSRAGILEGDILRAINERPALFAADAAREVFRTGVWSQAAYELIRRGEIVRVKVVVAPQESVGAIRHYLETLGLVYLALGAFILVRRRTTQQWPPLYVFCLASFALYAFAYTGKLDVLDWAVYWVNVIALLVQPAIFLHFCLSFPDRRGPSPTSAQAAGAWNACGDFALRNALRAALFPWIHPRTLDDFLRVLADIFAFDFRLCPLPQRLRPYEAAQPACRVDSLEFAFKSTTKGDKTGSFSIRMSTFGRDLFGPRPDSGSR